MSVGIEKVDRVVSDARRIFDAAVAGVSPETLIDRAIERNDLVADVERYKRVLLIAVGKAGARMTARMLRHLPRRTETQATVPSGTDTSMLSKVEFMVSAHPVPDNSSVRAAERALSLARTAGDRDIAFIMISGGGSSLWAGVPEGLTLSDKQSTVRALLRSGATIHEINTVRKHISTIKGGRLATALFPAAGRSLIISDVVGDDLNVIASGPTVGDPTTFSDALDVVKRRGGLGAYPTAAVTYLVAGVHGEVPETPGVDADEVRRHQAFLIGSNGDALAAAAEEASRRGYGVKIVSSSMTGDAAQVGTSMARTLLTERTDRPLCLLWGGETTVQVTGTGRGGRNQELVLAAATVLSGSDKKVALLSGGTDGVDGPTDAAGAVATPLTLELGMRAGLDAIRYLANNDSYGYFARCGEGHVLMGPTGTNVMDIQVGLVWPE